MNKLLGSSVNPEKLSLTIKGVLLGLVPVILIFGGGRINEIELIALIEAIAMCVASVMVLYGLGRKIWVKFFG